MRPRTLHGFTIMGWTAPDGRRGFIWVSEDEQRRSETVWPTARESALDAMARLHGVIDLASHGRAMLRLLAARARISLTNTQADAILDRLRGLGFTVVPFRRLARLIRRLVATAVQRAIGADQLAESASCFNKSGHVLTEKAC